MPLVELAIKGLLVFPAVSSTEPLMPGLFFKNSGAGGHAGQGGFEKPADELRLAAGTGLRENAIGVAARRRLGDFEPRNGGEEPVAANDFRQKAGFGNGQPEI